jgi:hypothetical protein
MRLSVLERCVGINTRVEYDVSHLRSHPVTYVVKIDGHDVDVPLQVYYSCHCFTRSKTTGDDDSAVLFKESHKNGRIDQRVFCEKRYAFSLSLPGIVTTLGQSMCYRGGKGELFYKAIPDAKARIRTHGWYVCGRLDANVTHQELRLNIRSAHYRTNEPNDVRGQTRFYQILQPFYLAQKYKYDWL